MSTLTLAQIHADKPVPGWAGPIVHQVEVLTERNLAECLSNKQAMFNRVQNQVNALPPGAAYYLDFEPGNDKPDTTQLEGWFRVDVQALWRELHAKHPKAGLFGGVAFDSFLTKQAAQAQAVLVGVPYLGFPCYHGGNGSVPVALDQHLSQTRARLGRLKAAGIAFVPFVWDEWHNSAGTIAGTPVPLADFIAGVSACREYAETVCVWSWRTDWVGTDEASVRTATAVGDAEPTLAGIDTLASANALVQAAYNAAAAERDRALEAWGVEVDARQAAIAERDATVAANDVLTADLESANARLAGAKVRAAELVALLEGV